MNTETYQVIFDVFENTRKKSLLISQHSFFLQKVFVAVKNTRKHVRLSERKNLCDEEF